MSSSDLYDLLPPLPERFNLCEYFLDHNLEEGRSEKVALVLGSETRTYGEVATRVRQLAAGLRRLGLRPEERVLIVLPDGFEFVETWFACLRAGGVFAMVNPLQPAEAFEHYLEYTRARIVVTTSEVLPQLSEAARTSEWCETVLIVGDDAGEFTSYEATLAAEDPEGEGARVAPTGPDDLAGWLFTSGSTGAPKACVHAHSDFRWGTECYGLRTAGYREDDVCLSVPKLFFGYATGTNLMFPFRVGATVVLFEGRATADEIFDQVEQHRPTFLTGVPTLFNNMLRSPRLEEVDLSSLRVSLSAGEALPEALLAEWLERTGIEVLDGIGSAEMFHIYISNRPGDVRPGSLGRVVEGYEVEIVDPAGQPVPAGEPGRLRVRGGSTALCYWADKRKSRETFQGEWCTSADIFRCDEEGYFYYEGRADDLLKVSGIWVSPLEIENALLSHAAVREVCVVGREDEQGLVKPHAFIAPADGHEGCEALAEALKAHVKQRLAPYKYPRSFEWRDELPKNDRGKIARKQLEIQ